MIMVSLAPGPPAALGPLRPSPKIEGMSAQKVTLSEGN
jgi:hypothetical protein